MKTIILFLFVFSVGLSLKGMGQSVAEVEGRYFVNNNPNEEVKIEHYQDNDFYVVAAGQWEGFFRFTLPQKAMNGLWARFKPAPQAKNQVNSGQYVGVLQSDGRITVMILPESSKASVQVVEWIPAPKATR
ncbi:MAG: hypothetical protein U0X91_31065 [Spirosomataceae bacterium]